MSPIARSCQICAVTTTQCFCSLSRESLLGMQSLGSHVHLSSGDTLLREGFSADRVFVVCEGALKLSASSADGKLLLLRIAGPGDVIGLSAAIKGAQHEVTAEALEPATVKSIPRSEFLSFMESFRDVSFNTARTMATEYDGMLHTARRLALSNSAAGKLAAALLDWGRLKRPVNGTALRFNMPLTHEELGNMAGISRETVTRLVTKFRGEGLLEFESGVMTLPAPGKLEARYC